MRAGGCTVQQALTNEAANIVKQAVSLARRRGHAQVTPLHVANTMLSSSTGLLRTACLRSHSHPLQCKALELCFNVALNRLPASNLSPMLSPHAHHPSLSNALVAAFKRAQAHQRRGSIENQQQPLLAVKIEIEQLIISILDDPSVSRVMREAGFSSTQVKSNVEQVVSLDICAPNSTLSKPKEGNALVLGGSVSSSPSSSMGHFGVKIGKSRPFDHVRSEDVMSVVDNLMNRRSRSTVIVGECLTTAEGVIRGLKEKIDKGDVPIELRNLQFISLPLFSFGHLSKEEVEQKLGEIRCHVKSYVGRGAVLYLGDLKWAAEYRAGSSERSYYCPIDHMIMDLGRLICGVGDSGKLWLMGIATYQTYMRCRIGQPSLETVWSLQPVTIPAGGLGLSLNSDSDLEDQLRSKKTGDGSAWPLLEGGSKKHQLICCEDCTAKFDMEIRSLEITTGTHDSTTTTTSTLPSWLQQYKEENKRLTSHDQECVQVRDLCEKWNSICTSIHKYHHNPQDRTLNFSSISPSSSSISSYDQHCTNLHQTHQAWPAIRGAKHQWREHHFWVSDGVDENFEQPDLTMYIPEHREPKLTLLPNTATSNPNSGSSSETMEMEYLPRFMELNAENLKNLCNGLEQKVPWQKCIISEISSTILQCRSGMVKRKGNLKPNESKVDTWLFFQGGDIDGKEKIARELASLVFGSLTNFTSIGFSNFSSPRSDTTDDLRNKRSRAESSCSYLERFADEIRSNPHRVFLMDDIEQVDYYSQLGIQRAIQSGRINDSDGNDALVCDTIVILSCERFDSRSRASSPVKQKTGEEKGDESDKEISPCVSLDLNLSIEGDNVDDPSLDDVGLLECVDRQFVFKLQEDL